MSVATEAGCGMLLRTSVKVNPKHKLWPSALLIVKVSLNHSSLAPARSCIDRYYIYTNSPTPADANLFKEAFEKAQEENQKLFSAVASE